MFASDAATFLADSDAQLSWTPSAGGSTLGGPILFDRADEGEDSGKIATIIDVVDENKALIDGPFSVTGVKRQVISFKRLALTDLTVKVPRQAREATLKKALAAEGTVAKWNGTTWAKKIANKKTRAELSDFDRFKTMIARKQKSSLIKKTIAAARKN